MSDETHYEWSIGPVKMTLTRKDQANGWCYWTYAFEFNNLGRIAARSMDGVSYHDYVRQMLDSAESCLQVSTKDHDLHSRVASYMTEFPFLSKEVTA